MYNIRFKSNYIKFYLKVWNIRIDLHFINNDGNMISCSSIATIAALLHFRNKDITVIGENVKIVNKLIINLLSILLEKKFL